MRLPGLTDVRSAFTDAALATLQIDPALPVVAFRIPNVGELSRKEREDNHPLFDQKKGAKFIDDFKRLAKSFPEAAAKVRELAGAVRRRLRHHRGRRPGAPHQGQRHQVRGPPLRARNQRLRRRRQLPHRASQEIRRAARRLSSHRRRPSKMRIPAMAVSPIDGAAAFHPIWIVDFPMFEYDLASGKVGAGASSVHRALQKPTWPTCISDPASRARQLLRPRDERP